MIRRKCKQSAFEYLLNKKREKGKDIQFNSLRMSEYLLPNDELDINEQRKIFELRNNMTEIKSNYVSEKENTSVCICGEKENQKHIYNCTNLNKKIPEVKYEKIYEENLKEILYIIRKFEEKENFQAILSCDPLLSVTMDSSNG